MNNLRLYLLGILAVYFGLRTLLFLPTLTRLLAALLTGKVKWPGPRIHDEIKNPNISQTRINKGYQNLYSSFVWNVFSILAVCVFFFLTFLSNTSLLSNYIVINWSWFFILMVLIVLFSGFLAAKRAGRHKDQVNMLLFDLANEKEPRSVDGQSARSKYAIEHPLMDDQKQIEDNKQAFDFYFESVICQQEGNQMRAMNLYQIALKEEPALHQIARELLLKMLGDVSIEQEGAICYWLGIHSEYLSDWNQARLWYEKSAQAYHKIDYTNRESRALCNLGNVKMQLRDPSAMDEFEKAITLNPQNGTAHLNIAKTYYAISESGDPRHDLALNAFADAILADPLTFGPDVIASLRNIGYTWKDDMEEITKRVEEKRDNQQA